MTAPDPDAPPTLLTHIDQSPVQQLPVFDPAVRQFPRGFRNGAPDAGLSEMDLHLWTSHHLSQTDVVLRTLVSAPCCAHLVLRGSWLLHLWFEPTARLPHDLDFVDASGAAPDDFVIEAVQHLRSHLDRESGLVIDELRVCAIWTYEKVEGRRIAIPWAMNGLNGVVQVDVTFGEMIPSPPEAMAMGDAVVRVASMETSLAWKMLWLHTDSYPQGKDLFDAVLLSRHVGLSAPMRDWLNRAIRADWPSYDNNLARFDFDLTEWQHFALEYPTLAFDTSPSALKAELLHNLGLSNG